jgi:hypothetical protein
MKSYNSVLVLILCTFVFNVKAQRGYYDAPYSRYEANTAILVNATATPQSYKQSDLQSEASDQVCVDLSGADASVEWNLTTPGDGLVIRYSVPEGVFM